MKVVIFCGGVGIRMGDATRGIPKPMITVGGRPILWHLMNWYASWGHTDFILCVGYRADVVKEYLRRRCAPHRKRFGHSHAANVGRIDSANWRVSFLDTGIHASIADRLRATQPYIGDDDLFLCTYGDGLTDAPLDHMVEFLSATEKAGMFMSVRPQRWRMFGSTVASSCFGNGSSTSSALKRT